MGAAKNYDVQFRCDHFVQSLEAEISKATRRSRTDGEPVRCCQCTEGNRADSSSTACEEMSLNWRRRRAFKWSRTVVNAYLINPKSCGGGEDYRE